MGLGSQTNNFNSKLHCYQIKVVPLESNALSHPSMHCWNGPHLHHYGLHDDLYLREKKNDIRSKIRCFSSTVMFLLARKYGDVLSVVSRFIVVVKRP